MESFNKESEYNENSVGIEEFLNKGEQVKGALKYRYQDFIVNEIDPNMNIISINKKQLEIKPENKISEITEIKKTNLYKELSEDDINKLIPFFGKENLEKIEIYISELEAGDKSNKSIEINIPCPEEKDNRKKIHDLVREYFPLFDSKTVEKENERFIQIFHFSKMKKRKIYQKSEKYLQFTLMKTNFETLGAINYLSKILHKSPGFFGIAGTKDKRGITTQRITVFSTTTEELTRAINSKIWNKSLKITDIKYVDNKLRIGSLFGNRFTLAIRFINVTEEKIKQNIENLAKEGFINYFGMQRFGTMNFHTHDIGLNIMKRNFKETIDMLLGQIDSDDLINEIKKEFIDSQNFTRFLKRMPFKYKIERSIVEGLKRSNGTNYLGALMNLPKNTRDLYPHAYQSYLWNKAASIRIRIGGNKPIIGDIVKLGQKNKLPKQEINLIEEEIPEEKLNESINEIIEDPFEDEVKEILVLNENNIHQYTIEDVLIPIIGCDLELPNECILKKILYDLLEEDGISFEDFFKSSKEFFVNGGYRYLIAKPLDVKWKLINFNNPQIDLLDQYYNELDSLDFKENLDKGNYKALIVQFSLKKSQYATMCIRELLKFSSAYKDQIEFNNNINFVVENKEEEKKI